MGGYRGGKQTVEGVKCLDVNWLNRNGYFKTYFTPGKSALGTVRWTYNGNPSGDIRTRTEEGRFILEYKYRQGGEDWEEVTQGISLIWTSCNYGGQRPWFTCSNCGRKVGKLYAGSKYFLCRHCYNLVYQSQREPLHYRLMNKAHNIQKKLGGHPGSAYSFPEKPKGMHWKTYNRLYKEYEFYDNASWIGAGIKMGIIEP